jgi:hypothetical protein
MSAASLAGRATITGLQAYSPAALDQPFTSQASFCVARKRAPTESQAVLGVLSLKSGAPL